MPWLQARGSTAVLPRREPRLPPPAIRLGATPRVLAGGAGWGLGGAEGGLSWSERRGGTAVPQRTVAVCRRGRGFLAVVFVLVATL